jgi:hypothetical protein
LLSSAVDGSRLFEGDVVGGVAVDGVGRSRDWARVTMERSSMNEKSEDEEEAEKSIVSDVRRGGREG